MSKGYDAVHEHVAWILSHHGGYENLCQVDVLSLTIRAVRCYDSWNGKKNLQEHCTCDDERNEERAKEKRRAKGRGVLSREAIRAKALQDRDHRPRS